MSIKKVVVALLLMAPMFALAATKIVETTATGVGRDENEAIADALAHAVAQVNGTQSSLSVNTGSAVLEGKAKSVKDGKTETKEASITARTTPNARMSASGAIAGYEKVASKSLGDGKVEVTVKAKVKQTYTEVYNYNAAGSASGRKRVAVLTPNSDAGRYDFFGAVSSDEICEQLWTAIESGVLQSGQLSLLDRKTLGSSLDELDLVSSKLTSRQEKAKLGLIRGADLIVIPTLHQADHSVDTQVNPMTGVANSYERTLLEVEIRAVVPATGEILMDKRYTMYSAMDRVSAFRQIAAEMGLDVATVAQGRRLGNTVQTVIAEPVAMEQPRRPVEAPAPFKLPGDP